VEPLTARRIIEHAHGFFIDPDAERARIDAIIAGNLAADDRLALNDGRVVRRRCIPTASHGREVRIWIFRDITDEARAQDGLRMAQARQRDLLEAFPGYIWAVDADHRLVYVNPRAAAVYEPIVARPGMPAVDLFGEDIYARLRPAVDHALGGDTISFEWQRVNSQPRLPDVLLVRITPGVAADGRPMAYAFGVDITSLKQARDALRLAKEEAERASAAKTQFLSAISHELRTPLNAVIGFSRLLEAQDSANLTDRQRRQLGEVRKAGGHLLALINDLLDLARIESGRVDLDLQPVALDEVVDDCLPLLLPQARERGCTLARDTAGAWQVRADRMRLKQVLLNLLSNAVKYNRPQGRVELQARPEGDRLHISVGDEGDGLTAQAKAMLFRPFERLGADRRGVPGTGIGLALSRQLVLAMGGEIGVDSEPGAGSRFWLRLPLADAGAQPPGAAAAPPPPPASAPAAAPPAAAAIAAPARLAYVDDNPVNLVLMEGLLEDYPGLRLRTFGDARVALQHLTEYPAHLVLVDLQMPDLDGFGLFRALRSHPATRDTPVLAVTADATAATMARCHELGFAGYVTKPIDADQLLERIDHALAGRLRTDAASR
jgi:signal transduction histidine kinase/ActR/RegA family two-component response regulator